MEFSDNDKEMSMAAYVCKVRQLSANNDTAGVLVHSETLLKLGTRDIPQGPRAKAASSVLRSLTRNGRESVSREQSSMIGGNFHMTKNRT